MKLKDKINLKISRKIIWKMFQNIIQVIMRKKSKLDPQSILKNLKENGVPDPKSDGRRSQAKIDIENLTEVLQILADSGKYDIRSAFRYLKEQGLNVSFTTFKKHCSVNFSEFYSQNKIADKEKFNISSKSQNISELNSNFRDIDSEEL